MRKAMVWLFSFLVLIAGSYATHQRLYFIELEFNQGNLSEKGVYVVDGYFAEPEDGTYKATLFSLKGEPLFTSHFNVPRFILQYSEYNLSPVLLERVNFSITIPYFKNGGRVVIGQEGKDILSIDVSRFSIVCGDGMCHMGEDDSNCPRDCGAHPLPLLCDSDSICNPQCFEFDPDCTVLCGDGNCNDATENVLNCQKDCGMPKSQHPKYLDYYEFEIWNDLGGVRISEPRLGFGAYYEQTPAGELLQLRLLDRKGKSISSFIKNIVSNAQGITLRVPYSPIGDAIEFYRGGTRLAVLNVSQFAAFCGDNVCKGGENWQNCPTDCPPEKNTCTRDGVCIRGCRDPDCSRLWLVFLAIVVLLIGLALLAYRKFSKAR